MSDDEDFGLGTILSYERAVEIGEKWLPKLQEIAPADGWNFDDVIYRIKELEDSEYYLDVMLMGLGIYKDLPGPIPLEFIEDVKGFLAPTREEDYGVQESIRYYLDELGIPT